jgi:hypothetical protein
MDTTKWGSRDSTPAGYEAAEREVDLLAGDNEQHWAVVEDFELEFLIVMPYADAEAYAYWHDAEIQYANNSTPEYIAALEG